MGNRAARRGWGCLGPCGWDWHRVGTRSLARHLALALPGVFRHGQRRRGVECVSPFQPASPL